MAARLRDGWLASSLGFYSASGGSPGYNPNVLWRIVTTRAVLHLVLHAVVPLLVAVVFFRPR